MYHWIAFLSTSLFQIHIHVLVMDKQHLDYNIVYMYMCVHCTLGVMLKLHFFKL